MEAFRDGGVGLIFGEELGNFRPDECGDLAILFDQAGLRHDDLATLFALKSPFLELHNRCHPLTIQDRDGRSLLKVVLNHFPRAMRTGWRLIV